MKQVVTPFLSFLSMAIWPAAASAQSLVNGGLEQSAITSCAFNMVNAEFNSIMTGVTAFGNTPHAGSVGETDILVEGCLAGPHSGASAVMIACEATTTDRLALALTEPLQAGVTYRFGLQAMAWTQWSPVVHAIEVGVSNSSTSFGTPVGTLLPESMEWTPLELDITPAQSAAYITLRVVLDGVNGSVIIDDLVVESAASVSDASTAVEPFLRGTLVEETLAYVGSQPGDLLVLDQAGRTVRRFRVAGPASLPVVDLPSGSYLVALEQNGQRRVSRVVKP